MKKVKKWVRLILDSAYIRRNDGTYGVKRDVAATDTTVGNYLWNDISFEVNKVLPQYKINEMLLADSYEFKLETINWLNKGQLATTPWKMNLVNIPNDCVFDNRFGPDSSTLTFLYDRYSERAYDVGMERGLVTTNKGWLVSNQLRIQMARISHVLLATDQFLNHEFNSTTVVATTTTSYVASIIVEYEIPE